MSDLVFKKSAIGSFYNISVSAITLILGFIRAVLLMRLLGVDSFGTIALALVFSRFILAISSLGLDHALIQKKTPLPVGYSTHFILRVVLSLGSMLLCLGIAPLLKLRYEEQLVNIFLILLTVNLLDSTYATHIVILRRELRFGALAITNLFASLVMTIFTPLAAYLGAGVWSLVIEQALGSLVRWVSMWIILHPWKVSLQFNNAEARSQLSYGSQVVSGNFLLTVLDRFDDFWIGTALGSTALGYYSRAYDLTQYPERILSSPITTVLVSAYASFQEKRQELSKLFFRSSSLLVRAGLLISTIMLLATPELVSLLFTPRWLPIVPIFRWMIIYVILDPIYINLSTMLVSIGHPKLINQVRLIQACIFIPAVIILAKLWGTSGVAIAANLMMVIGVTLLIITCRKFIQYSLRRMWFSPLVSALVAYLVGLYISTRLSFDSTPVLLLTKVGAVFIPYCCILILLEFKDIRRYSLAALKSIIEGIKPQLHK